MAQQPEAIRLADVLAAGCTRRKELDEAGNELRRLHDREDSLQTQVDLLTATIESRGRRVTELSAQVERLQAERGQVVGWCNPGQLFELQQGRAPHAYFYPAKGVGASVPLYTSTPAVAQAGGADEPLWRVALVYSSPNPKKQIPWLAHGEADMLRVEAHSSFIRWLSSRSDSAALAAQPARVAMPLTAVEMEKGREQIFSVNNPYCPCDSKTFRKVAEWVQRHYGIGITPGDGSTK